MSILAIDTSTRYTSLALTKGEQVVGIENEIPYSQIESLSDLLNSLLEDNQLTTDDLEAIVLGSGPGSFTGLRIGYAFTKGLASVCKLPICALSSLMAYSYQALETHKLYICLADARRDESFFGAYLKNQDGHIEAIEKDQILKNDLIKGKLDQYLSNYQIDESDCCILESYEEDVISIETVKASRIAEGLLALYKQLNQSSGAYSLEQISGLKPNYLRGVAAKKLAHRSA